MVRVLSNRTIATCVGFSLILGWMPSTVRAQGAKDSVTPAMVESRIQACVRFLVNKQEDSGKWIGHEGYFTGQTALVTLSLLSAGKSPADPTVSKALEYLRRNPPQKVYECALQTMVFCMAEPNRDLALIRRNVDWLIKAQRKGGVGDAGSWSYDQMAGRGDPSNSQFALLALWEAQRIGVAIPQDTFVMAVAYWRGTQRGNPTIGGGWAYDNGGLDLCGSMTCAGVASLLIADDALNMADATVQDGKIQCCQGNPEPTPVDFGMHWLATNFSMTVNPANNPTGARGWFLYYAYAVERVGRLTGTRLIGSHDWYREGCDVLLQRSKLGHFGEDGAAENDEVTNTAFGLLFLSKGKRQVVIGRLDYRQTPQDPAEWSLHRRSVQNLTGHIERVWKRDLSWQTVQIATSKIADLMECPVLFISGRNDFRLDDRQKLLLKNYVDQGGFIFAEACNGDGSNGQAFDRAFREFVQEVFGQPLQRLPPSHPAWFAETRVDPQSLPEDFWLMGLEQCCRTTIIYAPSSLSCRWELHRPYGVSREYPESIQKELENATKIGVNVVSYATGRELKEKLDRPTIIEPMADAAPLLRGTFHLPKLQHAGGADDVPRAISNLLTLMKKEIPGIDVSTKTVLVPPIKSELEKHTIVYLHGRQSFAWTGEQREALRDFFENGGVLIGDAIGASPEFATSFREEMASILPDGTMQRVPTDHRMLTPELHGFDIRNVTLLNPVSEPGEAVQIQRRQGPPVLDVVLRNDKVVAIFSPYDISCALESRGSTQFRGYPTEDAAKIAINMVLYALYQ